MSRRQFTPRFVGALALTAIGCETAVSAQQIQAKQVESREQEYERAKALMDRMQSLSMTSIWYFVHLRNSLLPEKTALHYFMDVTTTPYRRVRDAYQKGARLSELQSLFGEYEDAVRPLPTDPAEFQKLANSKDDQKMLTAVKQWTIHHMASRENLLPTCTKVRKKLQTNVGIGGHTAEDLKGAVRIPLQSSGDSKADKELLERALKELAASGGEVGEKEIDSALQEIGALLEVIDQHAEKLTNEVRARGYSVTKDEVKKRIAGVVLEENTFWKSVLEKKRK